MDNPLEQNGGSFIRYQIAKDFHVSPFFDREGSYDLHFKPLTDRLDIRIALQKKEKTVFTAQLTGQAQPFSSRNLFKTISRYPITASLTMPRIGWEAGKLYFQRRLTVYKKPVARSEFTVRTPGPTSFEKWCMTQIKRVFAKKLKEESIELILPDQSRLVLGAAQGTTHASIVVRDYRFFSRLLLSGDIGLGESYTQWGVGYR